MGVRSVTSNKQTETVSLSKEERIPASFCKWTDFFFCVYHVKTLWGQTVNWFPEAPPWFQCIPTGSHPVLPVCCWRPLSIPCSCHESMLTAAFVPHKGQNYNLLAAPVHSYRTRPELKKCWITSRRNVNKQCKSSVWGSDAEPMERHMFCHHCDRSV